MKIPPWIKNADLHTELESIRASIRRLAEIRSDQDTSKAVDFISQGDLFLGQLEDWLLDDEQKQVLNQNEGAAFFLAAAAYLCDIGFLDGDDGHNAHPTGDNDQIAQKSLGQRSHDRIRCQWKDLGVADMARAEIIADIVWHIDPRTIRRTRHKVVKTSLFPIQWLMSLYWLVSCGSPKRWR